MKFLFLFATSFLLSSSAWADFKEGDGAVLFDVGFSDGGIALGAEYEYGISRTHGVGGYVRIFPDDEDEFGQDNVAPGVTAIGAFIRPHFNRQNWDFYVSPGFGLFMYELGDVDETILGPSLTIGLLYELSAKFSFGFENMRLYRWIGDEDEVDDYNLGTDTFLAKFRMIF